jgi:hypothetical protein
MPYAGALNALVGRADRPYPDADPVAATSTPRPFLARIPRMRQWYVIWFIWGLGLGWALSGGAFHSGTTNSVVSGLGPMNTFDGFANAALRRNSGACGFLQPAAGSEFLRAIGVTRAQVASSGGSGPLDGCSLLLSAVPTARISAFIQPSHGNMYTGVSQGSDPNKATITFGQSPKYVASLVNTPRDGWTIKTIRESPAQ